MRKLHVLIQFGIYDRHMQLDRARRRTRKTTRLVETHSPVHAILTERGAKHVNVNLQHSKRAFRLYEFEETA